MSNFSFQQRQRAVADQIEAQRAMDSSIEQPRNRRERRLFAKRTRLKNGKSRQA